MSVSFGFHNSLDGDRVYGATDFSRLFDGVINDGIFSGIGTHLIVEENSGMVVNVGAGRAWFDSTWTLVDSPEAITVPVSDLILDRIDVICLETNSSLAVRANTIKLVQGTPAGTPVAPTLTDTDEVKQYPLAEVYVGASVTSISQSVITNKVGTSATPFVTGILETVDIDDLLLQWNAAFQDMMSDTTSLFNTWFTSLTDILDENVAATLLLMIQDVNTPIGTNVASRNISFVTKSEETALMTIQLSTEVSGGPITITKNSDAALPLELYDGTPVESLPAGIYKLTYMDTRYVYSPSGGGSAMYGGSAVFNTTTGVSITHNLDTLNYIPIITPKTVSGYIGEVYVTKTLNSMVVYCTGSDASTAFDWAVSLVQTV